MKELKLDAQQSIYFARQLESIEAKVYETRYEQYKARTLIPVSFRDNPGAETVTYRSMDSVGYAAVVDNYSKDFPRVDVVMTEKPVKVKSLGDSYGYSIQDIRNAQMENLPLADWKAKAARKAMLQKENSLAFRGDALCGFDGLLNQPNVPIVALESAGAWDAAKSVDAIIADLNALANSVTIISREVEQADTLLLPVRQYSFLHSRRLPDTGTTLLKFFMDATPYIKNIESLNQLVGAGAGGTDRAVVYSRNPENLEMRVPQDFEQIPPQPDGMEFIIHCHQRFAGVEVRYPLSMAYMDGI